MTPELRPGRVRAPGSTSNLGAGFDCLGLAVDRELTAGFVPGGDGLELRRHGSLADLGGADHDDLLVRAFVHALQALGHREPRGVLDAHSDVPVGKGLGSSAAAVVVGVALARVVSGGEVDAEEAFRTALAEEGHGDNAAPAAFGGLRAVVGRGPAVRVLALELSERVGFGYAAPPVAVSTREARNALPASVPFERAAEGIWRMTALVRGLATGDGDLLELGFHDELHAPHRLALIPGARAAVEAARSAGAWGVTVSGAGSGLLAVGPAAVAAKLSAALAEGLAATHGRAGVISFPLRGLREGVRRVPVDGRD